MARLLSLVLLAMASLPAGVRADAPLPFVTDDWPKALAAARERNVPLFVEAWAPWCHTCRSMREFVLPDPSLRPRAGQFVWLEINTEDERNAAFLERFPVDALPTFAVHEPAEGRSILRFVGSMSVDQLHAFLDNGRIAVAGGGGDRHAADVALGRADALYAESKYAEAADAYRQALGAAPDGWTGYARAVESMLYAWARTQRHADAVQLAATALPRLAGTTSALNVAAGGLDAALGLDEADPDRAAHVQRFEAALRELLAAPPAGAAADDVSGAWIVLLGAREDAGDEAGARKVAEAWSAQLEAAAAAATTPQQRTVFDSHRLSAFLQLGQPERAIAFLQQSEKDFPGDYNPPARLAVAYKAMKKWDDALAAAERALALAYGPRKLLIYGTKSEALAGKGDVAGARRTLDEALAHAEALPAPRRDVYLARVRKAIESFGK